MESETLGSIELGGSGLPIQVRVLRKWIPHVRKDDICYLLVDQSGEAIVAIAHKDERKYVEPKFQTVSCYRIENYVCVSAKGYPTIIKYPVCLRIGATASVQELRNCEDLPRVYFELCSNEDMEKLIGNKQFVIDYIGLVHEKEYKAKPDSGEPFLKITLLNSSGKSIEAALWKEIITKTERFDKHAFDNADSPTIIAITSMRVVDFRGQTQLSSTSATYMYLNPSIDATVSLNSWFKAAQNNSQQAGMLQSGKTSGMILPRSNPTTIQDILQKDSQELNGKTFACNAAVTDFITFHNWYYNACPQCLNTAHKSGEAWACPTHGKTSAPKYMFRIIVKVADETGSTTTTIFDEAVTTLLGTTCSDLVNRDGYTDVATIPTPLHAIKGKTKKFFLQVQKDARTGNVRCTVNNISDVDLNINKPNTEATKSLAPATPSQATTTHSAPATVNILAKRALFPSPDNPISVSKLARYPDE